VHPHGLLEFLKELFRGGNSPQDAAEWFADTDLSPSQVADEAARVRELIDRLREQDADSVVAGCVQGTR
jgi:hypothetical protein